MFLEMMSIGSLPAFIIFIISPEKIISLFDNHSLINFLVNLTEYERSLYGFLIVAFLFILKAFLILLINYFEMNFLKQMDLENSKKLFSKYLHSPFLFHVYNNPSELTQNLNDIKRTTSVIFGFCTIIKEMLIILSIASLLILTNVKLFSYLILILIIPILFLLNYFKNLLLDRGEIARIFRTKRLKTIAESLSNIKFIKINNIENFVIDYFKKNNYLATHQDMVANYISKIPKVILETFSIITILLIVFFLYTKAGSLVDIIPIMTLLIVSIVRFIPSIGNILVALNNYKYHYPALKSYKLLFEENFNDNTFNKNTLKKIEFKKQILIESISYNYPNNEIKILRDLNLNIKKNQKVGISGKSGSGKSTLLNIIMGLIQPTEGKVTCDGNEIEGNIKNWYSKIGYVPQKVTLFDETIKNNICFGTNKNYFDDKNYDKAIKLAELEKFISSLPDKENTKIGHEGSLVSGGQFQRIGIARALYSNPEILVLDEPTSSLDKKIESSIIDSLFQIKDLTIILISHNDSVLSKCDKVINLDNIEKQI
ncbi:ABC transporter ATP-binding protein [Pelagibacterales bacterium SAG-MED39]|nr:ABC transporter ATP-binding protein [Pelagibacterales bacterium SAG-MED39]